MTYRSEALRPVRSTSVAAGRAPAIFVTPGHRGVGGSPPTDLAARGCALWRLTVRDFELSEVELQLLGECCRLLDEFESLRRAVERDGATVAGSTGQPRVHPAIGELRQHRLALGRLLAQLALPDAADDRLASSVQVRGRKAAQSRWAGSKRGKVS